MGRGTTALEAILNGRIPSGNDINPLSIFLIRPRMNPPSIDQIANCLNDINLPNCHSEIGAQESQFLEFFHPLFSQQQYPRKALY